MATPERLRALFITDPETFDKAAFFEYLAPAAPGERADGAEGADQLDRELQALRAHLTNTKADLQRLGTSLDDDIVRLRQQGRDFHKRFRGDLRSHRSNLSASRQRMEKAEEKLHQAGVMPKRVGHLLINTENARLRLVHAAQLLRLFQAFQAMPAFTAVDDHDAFVAAIPDLFREDGRLLEATKLLPALKRVCHGLEGPAYESAIRNVQQTSDFVERRLLNRFEEASTTEDTTTMRACATPLSRHFNGGSSLHNRYFNRIVMPKLLEVGAPLGTDEESAQDMLSRMFGAIHRVCAREFNVIRAVFPRDSVMRVTRMLVQRIFNDPAFGIQSRVDDVLSPAPPAPALPLADFLDVLAMVHEKTTALVNMLLEHCTSPAAAAPAAAASAVPPPLTRGKGEDDLDFALRAVDSDSDDDGPMGPGTIAEAKDTAFDVQARRDAEVLEGMRTYLEEQVFILFRDHKRDALKKETILFQTQVAKLMRGTCDTGALEGGGDAVSLPKIRGRMGDLPGLLNGVLGVRFVQQVCAFHSMSLSRIAVVQKVGEERAGATARTFSSLLRFLGQNVFLPCLAAAKLRAAVVPEFAQNPDAEHFAEVTKTLAAVRAALSVAEGYYQQIVAPMVSGAGTPTARTICVEARHRMVRDVESHATETLTLLLSSFLLGEEKALKDTHGKFDYAPKEQAELVPTHACVIFCQAVVELEKAVARALPKVDLLPMWFQLASSLKTAVLGQLLRMKISITGSFQLKTDLDAYRRCMTDTFPSDADIPAAFTDLEEIGTIFMVPGPNIAQLLGDGAVAALPKQTLIELIKRRTDFKVNQFQVADWAAALFAELGAEVPPPAPNAMLSPTGGTGSAPASPQGEVDSPKYPEKGEGGSFIRGLFKRGNNEA